MPRPAKQKLKKRPDGRYRCTYKGHYFYAYDPDVCLQLRDDYKLQEAAGVYKQKNPNVKEYAEKWLPLHKSGVSAKCYRDYEVQLEALSDAIGDRLVRDVTVDDAALVWAHYAGLSASTIKRARMLFVALFDTALENDLCRKNPFRGKFSQPPKGHAGTHRTLTAEEIALIQTVPHRMQLAALIMLYCGLRRGEVLALEKTDITPTEIHVTKAVRFAGNRPCVLSPKTAAGRRSVPVPAIIRPYLKQLHQRPVSTVNGQIMTDTAFRRAWDSYIVHLSKAAGHEISIRPHDLRHTYCTMLRDAGVDMHQAMLWMGHADEKMILHVYDHVTDSRTQTSIKKLDKMLLQGQKKGQSKNGKQKKPDTTT